MIDRKGGNLIRGERGVAMLEYVLLGAVFIVIFVTASIYLRSAGLSRANSSMNTASSIVPCDSDDLTGDQCY